MIFKVKNLGIIEEAEVDLGKDLILLTGHNNTGKTYLAYAIYGLNKHYPLEWCELSLGEASLEIDLLATIQKVSFKNMIELELAKFYAGRLNNFKSTKFELAFLQSTLKLKILKFEYYKEIKVNDANDLKIEFRKQKNTTLLEIIYISNSDSFSSYYFEEIYKDVILDCIQTLLFNNIYIAPSERNAVNIFSKELALSKNKVLNAILHSNGDNSPLIRQAKDTINRYPKPIRDNLEIAEDLANLSKQKSDFTHLAEELEQDLLKGKIIISEHGQAEYLPDNEDSLNLELHLTGSIVKSLANIVFYLRHLAKPYDTIIIDEPELNLHPDNQRLIARFLGRLVNEGFKVIVSTHSDYIVRELNNMIMLSQEHENRDALLEKYGYQKNQLVKPQQVEALLFTKDSRKPTKIEVDESGLTVKTIDEVIEQMNISAEDIYFQLFEKVG